MVREWCDDEFDDEEEFVLLTVEVIAEIGQPLLVLRFHVI